MAEAEAVEGGGGSLAAFLQRLAGVGYLADPALAAALQLSLQLQRPLLLEGEAGVGKTEVAKALSRLLGRRLIRLQCYEGLDASAALYEWNYQRQLLAIKAHEHDGASAEAIETQIFSERYLLRRPLLEAIDSEEPVVLLIDEIDRADEAFEAYLLEVLSDYQVTVPELGTMEARSTPATILTSNATRALSDALRRRCLYAYADFPDSERELAILRQRLPALEETLARQIVGFVQSLRKEDLEKLPGIAETLDWAGALLSLGFADLSTADPTGLQTTLVCLLKTEADHKALAPEAVSRLAGCAA
ncbi:MAG: MoxR family ATPase [Rhodospirillales bacterium]|nr:MoxR family ATPase [Rhodospirillales bacterium]